MTLEDAPDGAVPLPGEQWPDDAPPTARQDHVVLSWLVVDGQLPESVRGHLLAALTAWDPLMGGELFQVEPLAGPECDVAGLLEGQWWRRAEQAGSVGRHDRVALVEVCGRLGSAIADVRGRRVGRSRRTGLELRGLSDRGARAGDSSRLRSIAWLPVVARARRDRTSGPGGSRRRGPVRCRWPVLRRRR
jgi:hypothetical protein